MSEKLLKRMKELVQSQTTILPHTSFDRVIYQLDQYKELPTVYPAMILILSEFGCLYDVIYKETSQVLLDHLCVDIDATNTPLIEASILGIGNIMRTSRPMMREIVAFFMSRATITEGELIAMVYLFEQFKTVASTDLLEPIQRLCGILGGTRYPDEKRVLAAYLAGRF
jgi:hypothetical protein